MVKTDNNSTTSSSCQTWLCKLTARRNLTQKEAALLIRELMSETVSDTLKAALLTALATKGEAAEEIAGMAQTMREFSVKVPTKNPLLDTCGTGGSGLRRLNVSTASAFILASCGVYVAKHGNRAASGRVGSFDVLETLGANIELSPAQVAQTIKQTNIGFIFAPMYHPAMKNIMPVRKALGIKTIFNLLGPLTNPAGAKYQVLGVSDPKIGPTMISVLKKLGSKRAMVVYGEDGLDEITTTAGTRVWELLTPHTPPLRKGGIKGGYIRSYRITPEEFGIKRVSFAKIKGGDAAHNARVIQGVLDGTIADARRDIILLNAAAGLYVYGKARSIKEGAAIARRAIQNGLAKAKFTEYIAMSKKI